MLKGVILAHTEKVDASSSDIAIDNNLLSKWTKGKVKALYAKGCFNFAFFNGKNSGK